MEGMGKTTEMSSQEWYNSNQVCLTHKAGTRYNCTSMHTYGVFMPLKTKTNLNYN